MRTLIICCAAATLALAACQRPAEETADAPMAEDAAMDAASTDAGSGAGATSAATGSAAPAATDAAADTSATTAAPMDDGMEASSPVSPSTRDGAKEKAESTNLHPRT